VEFLVKTPDLLYEIVDKKNCGLEWIGVVYAWSKLMTYYMRSKKDCGLEWSSGSWACLIIARCYRCQNVVLTQVLARLGQPPRPKRRSRLGSDPIPPPGGLTQPCSHYWKQNSQELRAYQYLDHEAFRQPSQPYLRGYIAMMVAPLGKHVLNNGHASRNDWYKRQGPEADLLQLHSRE
jgi:hypothetical protein